MVIIPCHLQKGKGKMTYTVPVISKSLLDQTHVLVGGTTGCGKSTLLHSIMYTGLAMNDKWFILIDPKMTELAKYKKCSGVIKYASTADEAVSALDVAISIMEQRQKKASRMGWSMYDGDDIYVMIDELADLMLSAKGKVIERQLQRLLQVARSARIHVIACTQAPNRKTIPASIQLNMTCVCGMACRNAIESKQLIGMNGCELLPLPVPGEDPQRLMYVQIAGRREPGLWEVPYINDDTVRAMIKARPRKLFQGMPA